jgi:hypothetical protein
VATAGFEVGRIYNRRRDIHARFGGQQQGGISTPARFPVIFAFTGDTGMRHGYADGWTEDGVFRYFGEGQEGDMRLAAGNRAIAEHAAAGKDLLVFQTLGRGKYALSGLLVALDIKSNRRPIGSVRNETRSYFHWFPRAAERVSRQTAALTLHPW